MRDAYIGTVASSARGRSGPAARGAAAVAPRHTPAGRIGGSGVSSDVTVGVAQATPDDAQIDPRQALEALRRELDARTAERDEALAQQAAISEILQIINSSPGDLAPVFDAMLEKATNLCEASFGILRTWDGERFHFGAVHGDPRFCDWVQQRGPIRPDRDASPLGRIQAGERVVHITDAQNDEAYRVSAGCREM